MSIHAFISPHQFLFDVELVKAIPVENGGEASQNNQPNRPRYARQFWARPELGYGVSRCRSGGKYREPLAHDRRDQAPPEVVGTLTKLVNFIEQLRDAAFHVRLSARAGGRDACVVDQIFTGGCSGIITASSILIELTVCILVELATLLIKLLTALVIAEVILIAAATKRRQLDERLLLLLLWSMVYLRESEQ